MAIAIGIVIAGVGGLYAFQQIIPPTEVTEGSFERIIWERSGGLIGLDEELVIFPDGSVRYSSEEFVENADRIAITHLIREDEIANLIAFTDSIGDEVFLPDPSASDFFTYKVTIETTLGSSTIEWIDDWASQESLANEIEGLQGQIESIIVRIWFESGVSGKADERAIRVAEEFILQSPTFKFDGISESLEIGEFVTLESIPPIYNIQISFDSMNAGFGNRAGQALAEVITHHEALVVVIREHVVSAVIDDQWDELRQEPHIGRIPPSGPLPQIVLLQGGPASIARHQGLQGSYCWGPVNPGEPALCVDFAPPEAREEEFNSLSSIDVENGSEINFMIDGFEEPDTYFVSIYSASQDAYVFSGQIDGLLTIDLPAGTY
ncbi:MAG: hypothetical protein V3U49_04290, partial [Nitrososphaerales archaeon]